MLVAMPLEGFRFYIRYTVFMVPLTFLAMAKVVQLSGDKSLLSKTILILSVFFSILSISVLALSRQPVYRIDFALKDYFTGKPVSEFKYYQQSTWYLPHMRYLAEPLDFLTMDSPPGLDCYIASAPEPFWLTNIYGSRLQNRVWNFSSSAHPPDVLAFQRADKPTEYLYLKKKITPTDAFSDPNYVLFLLS